MFSHNFIFRGTMNTVFVPVIPGGLFLALLVATVTKQDKKYKNILISCYSLRIPGNTFAKEHIKK